MEVKNGVVRFEHVNFRYPGAEEDVLHDIDFVAESGKTTAIIGSTGCRKSTLVNLIPRLYDVTGGSITLDGKDIRRITMKDLRDEIGFVPQKGVLFSGTIASNLRFGKDDASDEEIAKAAEIAQATEFIEAKDDKYETPIAQGGSNVSGGQKQRLAIARAILADNKILILVMKDGDISEQLFVISLLDDVPFLHDQDQISVFDGGKPVGDDKAGSALHQVIHSLLNPGSSVRVSTEEVASSRIQHPVIRQNGSGDGQRCFWP